ncbi:MAG: DUF2807 domain-containing protein [Candidatus Peribacteria bacterium]|jgi:hypothetical protein|nr:DUF2807 domain-containing protein [Candidatus Peribacteria bacterium]
MNKLHKTLLILIIIIVLFVGGLILLQTRHIPKLTGKTKTLTLHPQQLTDLYIAGLFTVQLTQTGSNEIKITADEALFDCLNLTENAEQVRITHKRNCMLFNLGMPKITIDVAFVQLSRLKLGGASHTHSTNEISLARPLYLKVSGASEASLTLDAPNIMGDISGASKFRANLLAKQMDFKISGASQATITGETTHLIVKVSGASDLQGAFLVAEKADVDAGGASTISANFVAQQMDFRLSGASEATITGATAYLTVKASGASDFQGEGLVAEKADVDASGASDITLNAKEMVHKKSSGASEIQIK